MEISSQIRLFAGVLLFIVTGVATTFAQTNVRAVVQPTDERKSAPEFALKDSSGKTVNLKDYRGKIVLLDFWATWCHGCKTEIPWFSDIARKYDGKSLAVVGVSLDEDGWKVVRPFLKTAQIPYTILLGDDGTAKQYGIGNMPDTFLIDREGRVAATYSGVVNKDNVEANLRSMLSEH